MSIFTTITNTTSVALSDAWNGAWPWGKDCKRELHEAHDHTVFLQKGIVHVVPAYQSIAHHLKMTIDALAKIARSLPAAQYPSAGGRLSATLWALTATVDLIWLDSWTRIKLLPRLVNRLAGAPAAEATAAIEMELLGTAVEGAAVAGGETAGGAAALAARAASITKWAGRASIVLFAAVIALDLVRGGVAVAERRNAIKKLDKAVRDLEVELSALAVHHRALRKAMEGLCNSLAEGDANSAKGKYVVVVDGNVRKRIYVKTLLADYDSILKRLEEHNGTMTVGQFEALCERIRTDIRLIASTTSTAKDKIDERRVELQTTARLAFNTGRKFPATHFRTKYTAVFGREMTEAIINYIERYGRNRVPHVKLTPNSKFVLEPATNPRASAPGLRPGARF